jgi:hypothetical protein
LESQCHQIQNWPHDIHESPTKKIQDGSIHSIQCKEPLCFGSWSRCSHSLAEQRLLLNYCSTSKYNRAESAGYRLFHVSKFLAGRERMKEREASQRFVYRPAIAQYTRYCRPLVAGCERYRRLSRFPAPPALIPSHRAPNPAFPPR